MDPFSPSQPCVFSLAVGAAFLALALLGWLRRRRTGRSFREILLRSVLLGAGLGVVISILVAGVLGRWILHLIPAG